MKNYTAENVDEYINNAPGEAQPKLSELRKLIKKIVPESEEGISWGIPFYRYHGLLGGFSAFKNHISFGLGGPRLEPEMREELEKRGYKTGTKVIQIRFDQKLPEPEIKILLERQIMKNLGK